MSKTKTRTSDARQRLIETAERLFYAEGIRAVGIDRIIAEAGVAKMTLYNHFASKDDLILAVLQYREEQVNEMFAKSRDAATEIPEDIRNITKPVIGYIGTVNEKVDVPLLDYISNKRKFQ